MLLHGLLGGVSFRDLDVGRGGRHAGRECEERKAARVLSQEETIVMS